LLTREERAVEPWLDHTTRLLCHEALNEAPGSMAVSSRMTELLFIQVLRLLAQRSETKGFLMALRDRRLSRALNAFHGDPARAWTLELMAESAGMSRSAFARHFSEIMSTTPGDYVSHWRMQLAAQRLRDSGESLDAIAEAVGYRSPAAFSRQFLRTFGERPGQWRKRQGS
ncbi:AraC family transcriptional regulator, partial [Natronospira sp.]